MGNATVELQAGVSMEDTEMDREPHLAGICQTDAAKTQSTEQLCAMKSASSALEIKSIRRATAGQNVKPDLDDISAMPSALRKVVTALKKEADPDCFPPIFVRNRLEMFEGDFKTGKQWIEMHRGYHIYKDFLADYYRVCLCIL